MLVEYEVHTKETVQLIGSIVFDVMLYGGRSAGATVIVYGGVPFVGVKEMSVH